MHYKNNSFGVKGSHKGSPSNKKCSESNRKVAFLVPPRVVLGPLLGGFVGVLRGPEMLIKH